MTTNYEYDNRSRLTKIEHKDGSTVKLGFTYTLDDGGNVTEVEYDGGETWKYFHDGRNRLTKAERDNSSATLQHRYTYTYDDADNLVTKQIYDGTTTATDAFAYNDANELTKHNDGTDVIDFEYDAWGRMTKKKQDTTYEATYAYRYGGKLYSVTSDFPGEGNVTYEYGADGLRKSHTIASTVTKYYHGGGALMNTKTGSSWKSLFYDYPSPSGSVLAEVNGSPASDDYLYFTPDNKGSTRGLFDENAAEVGRFEYEPFGGIYTKQGTDDTDIRFVGKLWDDQSETYHYPNREYSPALGRWLESDPARMLDGPNMFAFNRNNPTTLVDPLGLASTTFCFPISKKLVSEYERIIKVDYKMQTGGNYLCASLIQVQFHKQTTYSVTQTWQKRERCCTITVHTPSDFGYCNLPSNLADWISKRCWNQNKGAPYKKTFTRMEQETKSVQGWCGIAGVCAINPWTGEDSCGRNPTPPTPPGF